MNQEIYLGGRRIAADAPVFIVAEMSANHLQDYDRAIEIIHAAKEAGADAIKLQTYTADTMTVDSDADCFINKGGLWDGIKEYDLYKQAYTPWEWHAGLWRRQKMRTALLSPLLTQPPSIFSKSSTLPLIKLHLMR